VRAGRFVTWLFSVRGLFWLLWVWVLGYVTAAVWSKEAFARFMALMGGSLPVQAGAFIFVSVAAVSLVRFALRGFRARGPAFFLWSVFPAGAFFFLLGFVLMGVFGERELGFVKEGDVITTRWDGKDYTVMDLKVDLKQKKIMAEEPVGFLRSEPEAVIATREGSCEVKAFPPAYCRGTYVHIRDYGMAPGIVLYKRGVPVESGHVNLRILPPGSRDAIEIRGLPYRIFISLAPDRVVESEGKLHRLYDLEAPRYAVLVEKAGQVLFEGTSDDKVAFDGYVLGFSPYMKWVWLDMARGLGLPVMAMGLLLMTAGLPVSIVLIAFRLLAARGRALEA
jgi:hypothetical protein